MNLPRGPAARIQFRATDIESIVVLLLRTAMSVTDLPELREILRHWADALRNEQPQDFLAWRQRLSYDYRWLATTESDRIEIMHRLLCAMWNGQVKIIGDRWSPSRVVVSLPGKRPLAMELRLEPYGSASSWGSLLHAYEEWTFADSDQIRKDFCRKLMSTVPYGWREKSQPSKLYTWFVDVLWPSQEELLYRIIQAAPEPLDGWLRQLHSFWAETVPAAINREFSNTCGSNLGELHLRQSPGEHQ